MPTEFEKRLAEAQAAVKRSKNITGDGFAEDPEPGIYMGRLQTFAPVTSKKGRAQIRREILITEGESEGIVARDYPSMEQDFVVARVRTFIEQHGYEMPVPLFDEDQSLHKGEFVFCKDMIDTCLAIENDAPDYKFEFLKDSGEYARNSVIEIIAGEGGAAKPEATEPEEEAPAPQTRKGPPKKKASEEPVEDDILVRGMAFAVAQGVDEVDDGDDLETLTAKIAEYSFWSTDVTKTALAKAGLKGYEPADGLDEDGIAIVKELGLTRKVMVK